MGNFLQFGAQDTEAITAEGQVKANRILQSANNSAAVTIAGAQTMVRDANNGSATILAGAQTTIRDAQNRYQMGVTDAKQIMQAQGNYDADLVATAQQTVQASYNDAVASKSALAIWGQSATNSNKLDVAGQAYNVAQESIAQSIDKATAGNAYSRIQAGAEMGAAVAAAAARGVGNSSVELYNGSIKLRMALQSAQDAKTIQQASYNAQQRAGTIMAGTIASLDTSPITAQMDHTAIFANHDVNTYVADQDYTQYIAHIDYTPYTPKLDYSQWVDVKRPSIWGEVGAAVAGVAVGVATGNPMMGMQVANGISSVNSAQWAAGNGQTQQSQQYMNSAYQSFSSSMPAIRQTFGDISSGISNMFKSSSGGGVDFGDSNSNVGFA